MKKCCRLIKARSRRSRNEKEMDRAVACRYYAHFVWWTKDVFAFSPILSRAVTASGVYDGHTLRHFTANLFLLLRPMEKISFGEPQPFSGKKLLKMAVIQTGLSLPVLGILNIFRMLVFKQPGPDMMENVTSHVYYYLFLLLVFNPVAEEVVFRRLILQRLRPLGDKKALWISAAFFAAPHLFSLGVPQLGYTFTLGLVWGSVALKCNRLKECILLHTMYIVCFFRCF